MSKIHLYADKGHTFSRCAARASAPGKCRRNTRATYQYMASEILGWKDFIRVEPAHRCAHCCDMAIAPMNRQRIAAGKAPLAAVPYIAD